MIAQLGVFNVTAGNEAGRAVIILNRELSKSQNLLSLGGGWWLRPCSVILLNRKDA